MRFDHFMKAVKILSSYAPCAVSDECKMTISPTTRGLQLLGGPHLRELSAIDEAELQSVDVYWDGSRNCWIFGEI